MNNLVLFSYYLVQAISFIPLFIYLNWYKGRNFYFTPLFLYVSVNFILILTSNIFEIYLKNTFPVFQISTISLGVLMILILRKFSSKNKGYYNFGFLLLITTCLIDFYFIGGFWENNYTSNLAMNIIVSALSVIVIFDLINLEDDISPNQLEGKFYIAISFFVYNSSTFFFSLIEHKIRTEISSLFYVSYLSYLFLELVHYALLSFGIWKSAQK